MKNLHISNPCSEKWDSMSHQEKGRFCTVCNKCVIDFTEKKHHEIQAIIEEKKFEKICGRFYNHQLNTENSKSLNLKNQFMKHIPVNFRNNKITLTFFSLILFLTGCGKSKEQCITGDVVVDLEIDTTVNKNFVMEAPLMQNDSVFKRSKNDSIKLNNRSK